MSYVDDYGLPAVLVSLTRYADIRPRLMQTLLHRFGSLNAVLAADVEQLRDIEGLPAEAAEAIVRASTNLAAARDYIDSLNDRDILTLTYLDHDYPPGLSELNDPPLMLYARGRLPAPGRKLITVAGAERATNEGIALTTDLTRVLAEAGVQVMSSLRSGIDVAAHFGCRSAGGTSYALLDTGFDDDRLDELRPVAIDVVTDGGVISEYPPDHVEAEGDYRVANRLLAALPQAVVLTEFYSDSDKSMDLLRCCHQIGKLTFILIDTETGAHSDEEALQQAVEWGAIPMPGREKIDDIIKALV